MIDKSISKTALRYLSEIHERAGESDYDKDYESVYFQLTHYLNTRAQQLARIKELVDNGLIIARQGVTPLKLIVRVTDKGKEKLKEKAFGRVPKERKIKSTYNYMKS